MSTAPTPNAWLVTLYTYGMRPRLAEPGEAALFCRALAGLRRTLGFRVHAYAVLPDRVRLVLGNPGDRDPLWLQHAVQRLKSRYAREANARRGTLGLVWQDADQRMPLVDAADVEKRVAFVHQSPVLAGLAPDPGAWRHSSYQAYRGDRRGGVPVDPPAPPVSG